MTTTIIDRLADFTANLRYEDLPPNVVNESKRLLLDSIGCALSGLMHSKGTSAVEYAQILGQGRRGEESTILGVGRGVSPVAAGFANGELINALDFDAILPPGHVSPYVLPGALAMAEILRLSGKALICATALSHEMSNRIGKSMDYLRDIKDGKISPPKVYGFSSTVFGATAAVAYLRGQNAEQVANGLGIAGSISPVNSLRAWTQHAPSTTIKYTAAGPLVQAAMSAAYMAEMGHRGDRLMLDDGEFGYRRIIGSGRWEPEKITPGLGSEWFFPAEQSYKPYPHCRILHAPLDCLIDLVERNDIKVSEIEAINVWVEGFVMQPLWLLRDIKHVTDAQFSIAHGLSLGAHRIPRGKAWQAPEVVFDPSVMQLMDKIHCEVHPDYEKLLSAVSASRPTRIELRARGQVFVGETRYPKGSPSPDPTSWMTDEELADKFRGNAEGVLAPEQTEVVIKRLLTLEQVADFSSVMELLVPDATVPGKVRDVAAESLASG